jgi:hypothetical protein
VAKDARGLVFLRRLGVWLVPEGRLAKDAGGLVFLRRLARGLGLRTLLGVGQRRLGGLVPEGQQQQLRRLGVGLVPRLRTKGGGSRAKEARGRSSTAEEARGRSRT